MKKIWMILILPLFVFSDNVNGWTSLHDAIYASDARKIDIEMNKRQNIEKPSRAGIAPLHLAVKMRQMNTVEKLLSKGADIDVQDNNGLTPLHYAIGQKQTKLARFLIT